MTWEIIFVFYNSNESDQMATLGSIWLILLTVQMLIFHGHKTVSKRSSVKTNYISNLFPNCLFCFFQMWVYFVKRKIFPLNSFCSLKKSLCKPKFYVTISTRGDWIENNSYIVSPIISEIPRYLVELIQLRYTNFKYFSNLPCTYSVNH